MGEDQAAWEKEKDAIEEEAAKDDPSIQFERKHRARAATADDDDDDDDGSRHFDNLGVRRRDLETDADTEFFS